MPKDRPTVEGIAAELFDALLAEANFRRRIADVDTARVATDKESKDYFSATAAYNRGSAAQAEAAAKSLEEAAQAFRDFFCVDCGEFTSQSAPFGRTQVDLTDPSRCEDCAKRIREEAAAPALVLAPVFVAGGLLPDDLANIAAVDRSSMALQSEGYGRDFYR